MAINNIQSIGDDQQWKAEVERTIKDLQNQLIFLKSQIDTK